MVANRWRLHALDVERLVGVRGGLVAALRAGDALDQLERLQALHLVADRAGVAVDLLGDRLAFDGVFLFPVQVDEGREDAFLTRCELDR